MVEKVITLTTLGAAIALGVMIQSTSPSSTGPVGILAVFFCIYVILLGIVSWLLYSVSWLVERLPNKTSTHRKKLSMRRAYYYASVIALGPVILLAMGSVGRFGIYEVILTTLLVAIGVFYIQKRAA